MTKLQSRIRLALHVLLGLIMLLPIFLAPVMQ
jgi:hypothetical protein